MALDDEEEDDGGRFIKNIIHKPSSNNPNIFLEDDNAFKEN